MINHRSALSIVHYGDETRRVIREIALPCALRMREQPGITATFVRRVWKNGPQVQVVACGEQIDAVRDAVTGEIPYVSSQVKENPSTGTLDEAAYLRLSEKLGRAELVMPPYTPIWADNTVRMVASPTVDGLIVDIRAATLRDRLAGMFTDILALALRRAETAPGERTLIAFSFITLLAAGYPTAGLQHGHLSYKSSLEDFLYEHDQTGVFRAKIEAKYADVADAFVEYARGLVGDVKAPFSYTGDDELYAAWARLLDYGWREARKLAELKAILPLLHQGYLDRASALGEDVERKFRSGDQRGYSEFHLAMRDFDYKDEEGGFQFASYRFLNSFMATQLPLLDISPAERYFLAHAVTAVTETLSQTSWREIFAEGAAS
ncbi:hypothetical protein [Nonomuraea sp. NPDC052265]|uniref:hypothetical protein n=1 Tax=Nonomuraea sp. NPDC052265 TaxID=3364374 RepID=UPI0037CBE46F